MLGFLFIVVLFLVICGLLSKVWLIRVIHKDDDDRLLSNASLFEVVYKDDDEKK